MYSPIAILFGSILGILTFLCGFFAGMWLNRHNTRTIEVQKVEIVRVPEPHIVERPATTPPLTPVRPTNQGGTFVMAPDRRTELERRDEAAMGDLLNNMDAEFGGEPL